MIVISRELQKRVVEVVDDEQEQLSLWQGR